MNWWTDIEATVAGRRAIPTLSLFSGAGGLDIGFHLAGFDVRAAVEIEPAYCETLRHNVGVDRFFGPDVEVYCEDIREFVKTFDRKRFRDLRIECIIGGPPCQTFSAAGRRSGGVLGTDDERGQLFLAYSELLQAIRPRVFVFENVYGLPGANGGTAWREIVNEFSRLGYTLVADVVDAADFGVPQHRERLIMVGFRAGEFHLPLPTHGPDSPSGRALVSALEAIRDLQDPSEPEHDSLGGKYGHLLPLVPPGLNYSFFTAEMGYPTPLFAWRSKFHDFLHKADPSSPSRTIKARPGKFTGPFHWKNRHFTADELRRIQSFPDFYEIRGNYNTVVEQIGNSVPPRLAAAIALSVREQLFDEVPTPTLPARGVGFRSSFRQRQRERNRHFRAVAEAVIAERFASGAVHEEPDNERETYKLLSASFFETKMTPGRGRINQQPGERRYDVTVERTGSHLSLDHKEFGCESPHSIKIVIDGLSKYLISLESLGLTGKVETLTGLFHAWASIERALVDRSKFYSLIDIYGHYANRGDTVKVDLSIDGGDTSDPVVAALNFFGSTDHCGVFFEKNALRSTLDLTAAQLELVVAEMRQLRFDIRTRKTHPTISPTEIICTYPFPLLSAKAHLERKVRSVN